MDFSKLLEPIADYFNFVIDFVMFRGLTPFIRLGSVSPKLLSFLFVGILFALIVKRAKTIPTVGEDVSFSGSVGSQTSAQQKPAQPPDFSRLFDTSEMLLLFLFQISGTLVFHFSLMVASRVNHFEFGIFKDSLNVTIAVSSLQYPVMAILNRLVTFIQKIQNFNHKTRIIAAVIALFYLLILFIQLFYFFHAASVIHQVVLGRLILPGLITSGFVIVLILVVTYFANIWRTMYLHQFH
jgi:hypothetical protein